jgi:VWFA-related protein
MKTTALPTRSGMRLLRLGTVAACLAAAALPLHAAEKTQSQEQRYTEATEVIAVEVPVQVLKDGEPVRGLKADDFAVFEGRTPQPITGFEVLDLSAAAPAAGSPPAAGPTPAAAAKPAQIPPSARRRFVLLFDLGFTNPSSLVKARESAKTLLAGLHPADLVAVAAYSPVRGPELVLNFTADRKQAGEALDRLGYVVVAADPLRLSLPPMEAGGAGLGGGGGGHRGDGGDASVDSGPDTNAVLNAAVAKSGLQQKQRDVTAFTRATATFAKVLGSVQGRKYVVFLSEGFDNQLMLGSQDDAEILEMNEASARGQYWKVDSDARYGNTRLAGDVEKMIEELRRADCVVQAVDPGGLRAFGGENGIKPGSGQDSLFVIADGTGGELYRNYNDLSVAMSDVLKRTSVTYVLTYQPEGVKHDGTYRKLRVELKNARGMQVVYRPGYYAPKEYKDQTPLEKMLDTAGKVVSGQEGGAITTSVLVAPFQGAGDKAYVPVLIEVDGKSLLAGRQGKTLPVEIYTYAMDEKGTVQDYFAKTLALDLGKVEPVLQQSGIKFYGDLSLAPGSYSLRVLVRNGATGALSSRVVPLEVPAFTQASPVLLQPFFPEAPGRWLLVRETNEIPKDVPYPFQMESQPYIPAAQPVVQPGKEARLSLIGYHLQPGVLKADSRILRADGEEAGEGEIQVVNRQPGAAANDPDRLAVTFRPPALQPGDYLLLVTLTDAAGKAETSTASFSVAGKGVSG